MSTTRGTATLSHWLTRIGSSVPIAALSVSAGACSPVKIDEIEWKRSIKDDGATYQAKEGLEFLIAPTTLDGKHDLKTADVTIRTTDGERFEAVGVCPDPSVCIMGGFQLTYAGGKPMRFVFALPPKLKGEKLVLGIRGVGEATHD